MTSTKKVAEEFHRSNPNASTHAVKAHAESVSSDPDFVKAVVKEYFVISARQAKYAADVERIWPERKGY